MLLVQSMQLSTWLWWLSDIAFHLERFWQQTSKKNCLRIMPYIVWKLLHHHLKLLFSRHLFLEQVVYLYLLVCTWSKLERADFIQRSINNWAKDLKDKKKVKWKEQKGEHYSGLWQLEVLSKSIKIPFPICFKSPKIINHWNLFDSWIKSLKVSIARLAALFPKASQSLPAATAAN